MRPIFSNTLYEKNYPHIVDTLTGSVKFKATCLFREMYCCWGNIENINKWIKKAVAASKKGNSEEAKLEYIDKYLNNSGYFERKKKILSAIQEFRWQPGYIYIYILTNKFMPNLIKVGRVYGQGRSAYDRIKDKDLNCTGVPCRYDVRFQIYTINSSDAEDKSHKSLPGRVGNSEFFQNSKIENSKSAIIKAVKEVDQKAYAKSIGLRQSHFTFNS